MKVWNLATGGCDYAVVFAETEEKAKEKAAERTGIESQDWVCAEEFKPGMYGDVLWFY